MPSLRQVVTGLSPQRTVFHPRSVHISFAVHTGAVRQIFLGVLRFPPAEHLVALGNLQKDGAVWGIEGAFDRKVVSVLENLKTSAVNDIAIALQLSNARRMEGTWQGGPF